MASTDLTAQPAPVVNRLTGEQIAVSDASTETLAAYLADLALIREALADEETAVQRELLRRLDALGRWTEHVEGEGRDFTLKSSSPTAGTTDYDRHILRAGLVDLVGRGVVDPEAARSAVIRTITGTFCVDIAAEVADLRDSLERTTALLRTPVYGVTVTTAEKVSAAGVKRLERMGGAAAELVAQAKRPVPQGPRKVKVETRVKP